MADLPTNFKDDILDTSVNTRRRYRMYENTDGTIELEDVTEYSQVGNEFGAGQINETNTEVNKKFDKNMLVRDLDTINAITKEGYAPDALALKEVSESLGGLQFGVDENGNYGYIKAGADSVTPFKSGISTIGDMHTMSSESQTISADDCKVGDIYVCMAMSGSGKVSATNLVNCEILENGSAVGWENGSYQRSYIVIKCLDTNVSFTLNLHNGGNTGYSYYMRLS